VDLREVISRRWKIPRFIHYTWKLLCFQSGDISLSCLKEVFFGWKFEPNQIVCYFEEEPKWVRQPNQQMQILSYTKCLLKNFLLPIIMYCNPHPSYFFQSFRVTYRVESTMVPNSSTICSLNLPNFNAFYYQKLKLNRYQTFNN